MTSYRLRVTLRLKGISEFYAALVLLITSIVIAPKIISLINTYYSGIKASHVRPILVVEINETHALCYVAESWEPYKTKEILGDFKYWVYLYDIDSDGFLDPIVGNYGDIVPRDTYVLVSPPIICSK